jgi:hypothetical protein
MIPDSIWRDGCWEGEEDITQSSPAAADNTEDQPHLSTARKGKEHAMTPCTVPGDLFAGEGNALGLQDEPNDSEVRLEGDV